MIFRWRLRDDEAAEQRNRVMIILFDQTINPLPSLKLAHFAKAVKMAEGIEDKKLNLKIIIYRKEEKQDSRYRTDKEDSYESVRNPNEWRE